MRLIVTGGAGYVGSHVVVRLLEAGHAVTVVDNLARSSALVLDRLRELVPEGALDFRAADLRDADALAGIMQAAQPEVVFHFAGLKSVAESEADPLSYYDVNLGGTVRLLQAMDGVRCRKIVFSSSATVYGLPRYLPYDEDHPLAPESVYGRTKMLVEHLLADWARLTGGRALALRYFNPVGAHPSARIGEDPRQEPANLMPYLAQVAAGRRDQLRIWGDDYDTADGTGVRDYIHIEDLAEAHLAGLDRLERLEGFEALNIGTGRGHSVREMLAAFERVVGRALPSEVLPRRPGDIAEMAADCARAEAVLGWRARRGIDEMVASLWAWQQANPRGYDG